MVVITTSVWCLGGSKNMIGQFFGTFFGKLSGHFWNLSTLLLYGSVNLWKTVVNIILLIATLRYRTGVGDH